MHENRQKLISCKTQTHGWCCAGSPPGVWVQLVIRSWFSHCCCDTESKAEINQIKLHWRVQIKSLTLAASGWSPALIVEYGSTLCFSLSLLSVTHCLSGKTLHAWLQIVPLPCFSCFSLLSLVQMMVRLWVCLFLLAHVQTEAPPAKNIHLLAPEEHKLILNLGQKGQCAVLHQHCLLIHPQIFYRNTIQSDITWASLLILVLTNICLVLVLGCCCYKSQSFIAG